MLVASTREAVGIVRAMALWPKAERLPIISHWAVTGGVFFAQTRSILDQVDLTFLQTYSFLEPTFPERAASVARSYRDKYGVDGARNIAAPSGVAHAYDLLHMLALAIDKAGSADREAIQRALLGLKRYVGLVRDYNPPFRPGHQDALSAADFRWDASRRMAPSSPCQTRSFDNDCRIGQGTRGEPLPRDHYYIQGDADGRPRAFDYQLLNGRRPNKPSSGS